MAEREMPITIYLSGEMLARVEQMAATEKRKRAPMIAILVEEAVERRQSEERAS